MDPRFYIAFWNGNRNGLVSGSKCDLPRIACGLKIIDSILYAFGVRVDYGD